MLCTAGGFQKVIVPPCLRNSDNSASEGSARTARPDLGTARLAPNLDGPVADGDDLLQGGPQAVLHG